MSGIGEAAFVHLRVRSAYSLLEGALRIKQLAALAEAGAMPALAVTDTNNLFGALEFSEAMAAVGVQPIIGCTLSVAPRPGRPEANGGSRREMRDEGLASLALIAKDEAGYRNLMALSTRAFAAAGRGELVHVTHADLAEHADGLIALTGGPGGPVNQALLDRRPEDARAELDWLAATFPDRLYVELQRHGLPEEERTERFLVEAAYETGLPLVATNDAFFATPEEYEAHDALLCIASGAYVIEDDRRRLNPEFWLKPRADMAAAFANLPEAVASTVEIARRCSFRPTTSKPMLPHYFLEQPESGHSEAVEANEEEAEELRRQAREGLKARLDKQGCAPGLTPSEYESRLELELEIIIGMQFPGYFLIVADFIQWAKAQDIPVGPGRGSGAGSVVAWVLTITDLDPLRFGLLFERFLNPERVSMPDFDIDFCQDRRDEVIDYVRERYGEDRVAQIITFGKLQARAVLRDVGRVLQMPYGQVDRLCKMVPNDPANPVTLSAAVEGEPRLREARDTDSLVARMLDMGGKLEGLYRHASTHAAGVVIGNRPLVELIPVYRDPREDIPVTQFSMKWVEAAGLVKFDFLGLKTLTVIDRARLMLAEQGIDLDPLMLPLDDRATFNLLASGETVGVFQLESSGMREKLRSLKPDCFEDIIAMVALYRPGPMDNIDSFVARKHGLETPDYLHPLIRPILEETYGIIIYQEQVMQIAQVLSGYSLGEADLLRRAMGKKIKAEMDQQRVRFVEGALGNGVERARAEYIFELVAKFAGYGFNKSHAAAYALLAYQTAYLKANHAVAFLAASMTLDMGSTDRLGVFVEDAKRLGVSILGPSINASGTGFQVEDGAVRYALNALKTLGRPVAEHVVELRKSGGRFADLSDFATRFDRKIVNRRALETLACAGAFDEFETNRARVHANADVLLAGQNDLFGLGSARDGLRLKPAAPWLPIDRLAREFESVGFFLSGHPLDEFASELERARAVTWTTFCEQARKGLSEGCLAGVVTSIKERRSARGSRYAFVSLSDVSGQFEVVMFAETLAAAAEWLEPGTAVLVNVEAECDHDTVKLRTKSVRALDPARLQSCSTFEVHADASVPLDELADLLSAKGDSDVVLKMTIESGEVDIRLPQKCAVSPAHAKAVLELPGVLDVTLH